MVHVIGMLGKKTSVGWRDVHNISSSRPAKYYNPEGEWYESKMFMGAPSLCAKIDGFAKEIKVRLYEDKVDDYVHSVSVIFTGKKECDQL